VDFDLDTGELKIPQFGAHLNRKGEANIRRLLEIKDKSELLFHSLSAYLATIGPVENGQRIRRDPESSPIDISSNAPRFNDYSYYERVRHLRYIYYVNRPRLLRALGLRSQDLGFKEDEAESVSTFSAARKQYLVWWKEVLVREIYLYYHGIPERHPRYTIYLLLRAFLRGAAARAYLQTRRTGIPEPSISFPDFITEAFGWVARFQDQEDKASKRRANHVISTYSRIATLVKPYRRRR
jgi:hypothetical protein